MDVYRGKDLMPTTRKHKECKVQSNHETDYFQTENMKMPTSKEFIWKALQFLQPTKIVPKRGRMTVVCTSVPSTMSRQIVEFCTFYINIFHMHAGRKSNYK